MMLLRASSKILNRYLLTALIAPRLITHITRIAVGSGVKHLRVRDIEALPLPLPPRTEQLRIVAELERRLSVVDDLEFVVSTILQRATSLRQSISKKAFSGKSKTKDK
jgi:type I restriction enzyme S subunit